MALTEGSLRTPRSGPSAAFGSTTASRRTRRLLAPAAAGLLGFTISLVGITVPSVWYDEAATITSATRSWPQLWDMLRTVDTVHALYYFLMKVIFDTVGYSPLALRMPSAIAIGLAAALVVVLARQLGRPRLGWIAGFVFVLLPRVTWAGTEGRSYALTALAAVAVTVVFVHAQRRTRRRWWILYTALAIVSVSLFIYLALVVIAHGATVAWLALSRRRGATRAAISWALATTVAGAITLPFAMATIRQSGQVAWIDPISLATLQQTVRSQWFYSSWWFAGVAWVFILFGMIVLTRRRDRTLLPVIVPVLLLPTLALVLASVIGSPIYQPRYLTMGTPFAAIAIAAGLDLLRPRIVLAASLVLLVGLSLPQAISQRLPEAKENAAWSQVATLIETERAVEGPDATTAIIYGNLQRHPSATTRVIEYAYPAAFEGTVDLTLRTPAAETGRLWETHAPIGLSLAGLANVDVAYLITSNARDLRPQTTTAMAAAGWHVAQQWDFTAIHVLRYEHD